MGWSSGKRKITFARSLFNDMSKMTSSDVSNAIEVLDLINLDVGDDEEEVMEGPELDSSAVENPAVGGDDFMHTDDFRRLFVGFVMADTLVAMRWLERKWHKVVEKKLIELEDEPFGARLEKMKRLAKG